MPPVQKYVVYGSQHALIFFITDAAGGTTIRELLKYQRGGRRSKIKYIYLTGPREYENTVEQMKEWLVHGTGSIQGINQADPIGQIVVIEYHALDRNCPTFLDMSRQVLPQWKRQAKESGVPFFSFSILREPVAMAVSFFNYYHGIPQNPKRFDLIGENATETTFLEATISNPQCLFLARNEDAYTKTGRDLRASLTHDECREAYDNILELIDFVGMTERIRDETLPLLKDLLDTNQYAKRLIRNLDKRANQAGRSTIHLANLSDAAIKHIRSVTTWDSEMYERVKQDFAYDSWIKPDGEPER